METTVNEECVQGSGVVWGPTGDPIQPQPKATCMKRELPFHVLRPSYTEPGKINVFALEDGVLTFKGQIWQADGFHHCETGVYWPDKGWMGEPKGWLSDVEPDHFGSHCSTDPEEQKRAAIFRCITGARKS